MDIYDLMKAGQLIFGRDPARGLTLIKGLQDDQKNDDAMSNFTRLMAPVRGGLDPKTGISWNGPRQAPTGATETLQDAAPSDPDSPAGQDNPAGIARDQSGAAKFTPGRMPTNDLKDEVDSYDQDQAGSKSDAIQALMNSPMGQSLSAKAVLQKLYAPPVREKADAGQTLGHYDANDRFVPDYVAPAKPAEGFKIGATRDIKKGSSVETQEYQADGTWKTIATGDAFAPQQEQAPVEIDDPTSPTGRRLVSRGQAMNQPGPAQQSSQATANQLRDEFNKATEASRTVAMQYRNAVKSAASGSAAGDMGLIYSFMKALDPNSSVKEGEYAQGEDLAGSYGKFWQTYNKAKNGEKLLPEVRSDILNQMKNIYTTHIPTYEAAKSRYSDIASRQRLNPKDVVTDMPSVDDGTNEAPPKGVPQDAKKAPDGKWYSPDPARPGKYLQW